MANYIWKVLDVSPTGDNLPVGGQKLIDNWDVISSTFTIDDTTFDLTLSAKLIGTNGGSLTGTWDDLGTVVTMDLNGGTIDGAVIGGSTPAAGSFEAIVGTQLTLSGTTPITLSNSGTITSLKDSNSTRTGMVISNPSGVVGTLGSNSTNFRIDAPTGKLQFFTGTVLAMEFSALTPNAAFEGGIALSGDSAIAANLLDDYEEGTFTPVIIASAGSGTILYTTQQGKYTKIGNTVNFSIRIKTSSLASRTGNLKIGNLPFTPTGFVLQAVSVGLANGLAITAGQVVTGFARAGVAEIDLRLWDTVTGTTNLQSTDFTDDGELVVSGTYSI